MLARNNKRVRRNRYKRPPEKKKFRLGAPAIAGLRIFGGLVVLAAISLSFIFVHDFLTQCDYFDIREIVVTGNERLSVGEILEQAELEHPGNVLAVNLKLTRTRLMANPWVDEVEIGRELPGRLVLRVREQAPLAILDMGRPFIINTRGELFKEWTSGDPEGLIVVKGLDYSDLKDSGEEGARTFKAVMELLETDRRTGPTMPEFTIRQILVDREMGLTVSGGDRVRLVHMGYGNFEDKYRQLRNILVYIDDRSGYAGIDLIDMKSSDRIVVRPTPMPPPGKNKKEV